MSGDRMTDMRLAELRERNAALRETMRNCGVCAELINALLEERAAVARLRLRCTRQDGDPSVDALKRQANALPADWNTARTARALLRAWEEPDHES